MLTSCQKRGVLLGSAACIQICAVLWHTQPLSRSVPDILVPAFLQQPIDHLFCRQFALASHSVKQDFSPTSPTSQVHLSYCPANIPSRPWLAAKRWVSVNPLWMHMIFLLDIPQDCQSLSTDEMPLVGMSFQDLLRSVSPDHPRQTEFVKAEARNCHPKKNLQGLILLTTPDSQCHTSNCWLHALLAKKKLTVSCAEMADKTTAAMPLLILTLAMASQK